MYHYTETGLQNVWLANGYNVRKTSDGDAISIENADGLLIGGSMFVQFSDSTSSTIIAYFSCAQDASAFPNQGKVDVGDAALGGLLWLA
jgi:hypothetical protein